MIPPEVQQMITQVRQQYPQLAHLPDEQVAALIMQSMEGQTAEPPTSEADMETMSAAELGNIAIKLLDTGRWEEAEKYFFAAMEKAEKEEDFEAQCLSVQYLGRLCRKRGNFPQAMTLYQRALTLAERLNDRRLMGVIYDQIGSTYRMQGAYPQAIEYYKKAGEIFESIGDEKALS